MTTETAASEATTEKGHGKKNFAELPNAEKMNVFHKDLESVKRKVYEEKRVLDTEVNERLSKMEGYMENMAKRMEETSKRMEEMAGRDEAFHQQYTEIKGDTGSIRETITEVREFANPTTLNALKEEFAKATSREALMTLDKQWRRLAAKDDEAAVEGVIAAMDEGAGMANSPDVLDNLWRNVGRGFRKVFGNTVEGERVGKIVLGAIVSGAIVCVAAATGVAMGYVARFVWEAVVAGAAFGIIVGVGDIICEGIKSLAVKTLEAMRRFWAWVVCQCRGERQVSIKTEVVSAAA